MRRKNAFARFGRTCLLLMLTLCLLGADAAPVLAKQVTQADIDALKKDAGTLADRRKELEAQLDALADDKAQVLERRKLLDQRIENTSEQILNIEEQIDQYAALIAQKEAELADAESREAAQYDLFCDRIRAMEERGEISYWAVLFGASNFSDMLSRLHDVNEIMDADQRVIDDLKALQQEISAKKTSLEQNKAASEAARAELLGMKSDLDSQRQEAIALVNEIKNNENKYKATIDQLEEEEEKILAEALRLSKELAAQQAAQGQSTQSNPGGYIWPVDSRHITSTVGGRASPGGVGSTNHKGTDIGKVGYNSKIYAAKAGTVIVSEYSGSYGNYVVVSHGSGNTTLYAHMSQRKVKVGDVVKQGDVLGITGSTGNSTGPHLHFEIIENGVRVNPLLHGKQPCMGYLTGYTMSGTAVGK
ncbi:MAG: peptidase M23 [Ruminococcaceae bacterium]|nr:peptidase M23 [Oscillospiraceae bacterium]